jgi:Ras-related protein Rab-5C
LIYFRYYRNSNVALVVYDVTSSASLESAKTWVDELKVNSNDASVLIALVGNKIDMLPENSSINSDTNTSVTQTQNGNDVQKAARAYATENGLLPYDTSAKMGTNVAEMFTDIGTIQFNHILHLRAEREQKQRYTLRYEMIPKS